MRIRLIKYHKNPTAIAPWQIIISVDWGSGVREYRYKKPERNKINAKNE